MALSFDPRFGINPTEATTAVFRIPQYVEELKHHATLEDQRAEYVRSAALFREAKAALISLRQRGYPWLPTLEQGFRAAQLKAEGLRPAFASLDAVHRDKALTVLDAAATQVRALGQAAKTPALAGAIVAQFNGAARDLAAVTSALDAGLAELAQAATRLRALVKSIEQMFECMEKTAVTLRPGEQLILALPGKWDDAPGGEQRGQFVLTDQRVVFFEDENKAVGGNWLSHAKVQVREVTLDQPFSALASVAGGTEGWVFKDQVLYLAFSSGDPKLAEIEFDADALAGLPDDFDEAAEWTEVVQRLLKRSSPPTSDAIQAAALPDLPALHGAPEPPATPPAPPPRAAPEAPQGAAPPPPKPRELPWLEVELSLSGDGYLSVAVPGSSFGQHLPPTELRAVRWTTLQDFAEGLRKLAYEGVDLSPEARTLAWQLFGAVFSGKVAGSFHMGRGMAAAANAQLLVRLMVREPKLRAVPWEVMCGPDDETEFLAHHREIQVVRGLYGARPVENPAVSARPRMLVVAPGELSQGGAEMHESIRKLADPSWIIEPPLLGDEASWTGLTRRLQSTPDLAVLHLMAHGRVRDGVPEIKLAGHGAEWTPAELLAGALAESARRGLRLVYLESCVSGEAGELASAGERIAASGVEAVVAHLWPVSVRGARIVSTRFYETLLSGGGGDVAEALDAARLCAAGNLRSAEFLCPVLFMRGANPKVLS